MQRDDAYLLDMLLAAREARGFVSSLDIDGFRADRMAQLGGCAVENGAGP